MHVIGLTGGLGSGKSTVAAMFSALGAKVLDADKIAHRQIRPDGPCFRSVIKLLGGSILTAGRIDRKKIAERVFKDKRLLRQLEGIIHPVVRDVLVMAIERFKKGRRFRAVVTDVPLLFEVGFDRHVDLAVVVYASRRQQITRAARMLNISKLEAIRRIRAQMPLRQKIRLADIIIDNSGTFNQTQKQVKQLWEELR